MSRLQSYGVILTLLRATVPQPQHHWAKAHRKLFTVGAALSAIGILSASPSCAHWLLTARTTSAHPYHNRTVKTDFRGCQLSLGTHKYSKFRTLEKIPLNLPQSIQSGRGAAGFWIYSVNFTETCIRLSTNDAVKAGRPQEEKQGDFYAQLWIALCHGAWLLTF